MTNLLIAIGLGAIAGLIDTLPMLKTKIPRSSIRMIFMQWVIIGTLIPFVSWDMQSWLKGAIIGLMGMLPMIMLLQDRNPKAIPMTAIYGLGLGAAIGYASSILM